ncbi:6-phosphogluconolactonase [Natronosporangium hydrolyticum]|uniref:6-phosphogluconolactonase n=1 Tax=Natronosporangium hydrolyticum TaxID=2811111 RepID=A0A895YC86_9ACTN|nr:6-phosphogluconolactonase [Natronosporangium hydrolyticum]QSB12929.1 6-phosphogluconolactonase [Natronosporangium hydrolyticum]
MNTDVVIHPDRELLAHTVAARLLVSLVDAQSARGSASVVLTGGGVAAAVYRAVAASPARHTVDWSRVTFWWGDERFLPAGDPERNETQAREAFGSLFDEATVLPMPATDGPAGADPDAAAARYARQLADVGAPAELPHFDVLLLGVGEDGHVASIFPEHPAGYEIRTACAVRGAPKPPPTRITLTKAAINSAAQIWLIAGGAEKADAIEAAFSGAGPDQIPAAGVGGVERTLWLLDRAAAAGINPGVRTPH